MTKNEAMKKAKQIIDNHKRKTILEKRLTRLENLIKNEDMYDNVSYEDTGDEDIEGHNSYDICREIIDHYYAGDWIGEKDIDEYLDTYYDDIGDEDRLSVHDRMSKLVGVDPYRSVQDYDEDNEDWGEEDFESCRRNSRKPVKHESTKKTAKHSLLSRFRK